MKQWHFWRLWRILNALQRHSLSLPGATGMVRTWHLWRIRRLVAASMRHSEAITSMRVRLPVSIYHHAEERARVH